MSERQGKALLLMMLMMPQRCLGGDLNASRRSDGAMDVGESDSAKAIRRSCSEAMAGSPERSASSMQVN
jgi:hypothetical protein